MKNPSCVHIKKLVLALIIGSSGTTFAASPGLKKPIFLPGASIPRQQRPVSNDGPNLAPPPHSIVAPPNAAAKKVPYFYEKISNQNHFDSIASFSQGLVKGAAVKFFIDNRIKPAKIFFINGNFTEANGERPDYAQYHYYFAQKHLGINMDSDVFNNSTYFTNDIKKKKFIAGTLQRYEISTESEKQEFYGIQFYPQDEIAEGTLLFALGTVRKAIDKSINNLAFVAYGTQQTITSITTQTETLKIKLMTVDQVYSGISYIPMNLGKTYGILKFIDTKDQMDDLTPQDIAVFRELPLDLSVVAGVITTVVQDAGAHVNLKSKERNTPNMVMKDIAKLKEWRELYNNQFVEMSVENEQPVLKPAEKSVVEQFHADKEAAKPKSKIKNGPATEILLFDSLANKLSPLQLINSSDSYGGKASKLPLLAHNQISGIGSQLQKNLGYRLTPMGFSIPIKYYFDFVKANPTLDKELNDLKDREMSLNGLKPPSPKERAAIVSKIQDMFYTATIPEALFSQLKSMADALKQQVADTYPKSPLKKVKVRSSSNAEDIPQFDGAGLHSSFGAKIDKVGEADTECRIKVSQDGVATKEEMKPESIACAIKGVYASLWNKRAIEERNFARIDQHSAGMALAVNASYDFRDDSEGVDEIGNAVLVTRVINSNGVYGYRLSLNVDENLVTNPTPDTQSEIVIASFLGLQPEQDPQEKQNKKEEPKLSFLQFAKPVPGQETLKKALFNENVYKTLIRVARSVELSYCKNNPKYYKGDCAWITADLERPNSLDMEFKIYSNGEVLLKQVREFSGK